MNNKKYLCKFYQAGVEMIEPEEYASFREAARAGSEFLKSFTGIPGHHHEGSMYKEAAASVRDGSGATEAAAWINKVG